MRLLGVSPKHICAAVSLLRGSNSTGHCPVPWPGDVRVKTRPDQEGPFLPVAFTSHSVTAAVPPVALSSQEH